MKKRNNKKKAFLAVMVASTLGSSFVANADLYISPSVRQTVTVDESANKALSNKEDGQVVVGKSAETGNFVMQEKPKEESKAYASGVNVPLFFAVEANSPKDEGWKINIQESIQKKPVSWEDTSGNWEGTLNTIAKQNNLFVSINSVEKAIGFSTSEDLATHFAKKIPDVWYLNSGDSLKQSLERWSKKAGWNLQWSADLTVDYTIASNAVFTGKFVGEGGSVSKVLDSIGGAEVPLKATFYTKNKVVLITEAGYSQEVKF